jgi:hypothetical protein
MAVKDVCDIQPRASHRRWALSAKGYEYARGEFVTFTAEELKALDVASPSALWQAAAITGSDKSATARPAQRKVPASGPVQKNSSGMFDLIARGLIGAELLQPEQTPATRWAMRDLSVTINGRLASTMDELYPDAAGGVVPGKRGIDHGRMPLHQFKAPAGSLIVPPTAAADPILWNAEYAEFTADFVWTDAKNNEILRIADVPIVFA